MKNLVSLLFALSPILSIYATGIPGISFADLFILGVGTVSVVKKKYCTPYFVSYIIYTVFITFLSYLLGYNEFDISSRTLISFLMFFYMFNATPYIGDFKLVMKCLFSIGNICCTFFIFQYLVLLVSGFVIPGILSFFPLANEVNTDEFLVNVSNRDRLSSLFTEPAHFCEFLIIVLSIRLFVNNHNKKNIILAIIYTVCIYLSKSAIGFASSICIWGLWIIKYTQLWEKHKISFIALAVFLVFATIPLLSDVGEESIINRFTQISFTPEVSSYGFSSYIRVLRGYIPFIESDLLIKLFGSGVGSIYTFIKNNPNTDFLFYVDYLIDYLNSVQYVLFYSGIVGFLLLLKQFRILYIKTSKVGQVLLLVSLLQMFAAGYLFSMNFVIVIYVVINSIRYDINNYSNL